MLCSLSFQVCIKLCLDGLLKLVGKSFSCIHVE